MDGYWAAGSRSSLCSLAAFVAAAALTPVSLHAGACTALGGNFCTQTVNTTSGAQNLTVTATVAGTVRDVH
jgi:hypothetical protein